MSYDGTAALEISLGAGPHNASKVIGYKSKLVLAMESSLFLSVVGTPEDFDGVNGAAEVALGETIRELHVSQGALIIGCDKSTQAIYGVFDTELQPNKLNQNGAIAGTMQSIAGQVLSLDTNGVTAVSSSKNFGNFDAETFSNKVKTIFPNLISSGLKPVSMISSLKSQYRVFFGDFGLYLTFSSRGLAGISFVKYDVQVTCATDDDEPLFGSMDGFVYIADSSDRFDGAPITSFMALAFNNANSPTTRKRYRKIIVDARAIGSLPRLYFQPVFDYGGSKIAGQAKEAKIDGLSGGGLWDFSRWDQFNWDSQYYSSAKARISGVGENMGLIISSDGEGGKYEIYGITHHFSMRGLQR